MMQKSEEIVDDFSIHAKLFIHFWVVHEIFICFFTSLTNLALLLAQFVCLVARNFLINFFIAFFENK